MFLPKRHHTAMPISDPTHFVSPPRTATAVTLSLAIAALLSACAAPHAPAVPATEGVPDAFTAQFKETAGVGSGETGNPASGSTVQSDWWSVFQDPELNALEQQLLIGNENLKLIVAQVASARAALQGSDRAGQPTLNASLGGTRSAATGSGNNTASPLNAVSANATASWEPDLWGRLALATQNSQATLRASESDLAAARLSAQSTLAQSYFSLRSAEAQQALLSESLQAYQRALELTQARYDSGVAARTDVLQAQAQLESARTQASEAAATRAQVEHAIAVLLGKAPSVFSIPVTAHLPDPVSVPNTLPGALLQRRPDIAAAQFRVRAAYAQIGVTDAAYFPSVTLSASGGYSQSSLANLLSAPNLLWSLGASLTENVFDAGVRQQASETARATAAQTTASYRSLVLTALQEVEDNLVLVRHLNHEVQSQTAAWQANVRTLEITNAQYQAGTVGYLSVTSAQSAALSSQITLISVQTRLLNATNVLLKNTAGPWNTGPEQRPAT